jgi:hypothetical protein
MKRTLRGLGFAVLGLAVVTVGLPVLVLVASFLGMLIGAYVFPALIALALLRFLFWDFPRALKYRTVTGEWPSVQTQRREGAAMVRDFKQYINETKPWD